MGTRVYIGRLRAHTGEREIEDFFRGYGKIDSVNMKNGFAFVEFADRRDAGDAVHELNGKTLDGYRVIVDHARGTQRRFDDDFRGGGGGGGYRGGGGRGDSYRRPSPPRRRRRSRSLERSEHRLIVRNLSSRVSWQDLKDLFRPMGEVVFADAHTKAKNEGVVEFAREKDMLKALDDMQGKEVNGREIELSEEKKAARRSSRSPSRSGSSRSRSPDDRKRKRDSRSRSRTPPDNKGQRQETDSYENGHPKDD